MGLLDDLFSTRSVTDDTPADTVSTSFVDMSGGVPVFRKKTAEEKFDVGKKKFDETNPYVPAQQTPAGGTFPAIATPKRPELSTDRARGILAPEMVGPYGAISSGPYNPPVGGRPSNDPSWAEGHPGVTPAPAQPPVPPPAALPGAGSAGGLDPSLLKGPTSGAPPFQSANLPPQSAPVQGRGSPQQASGSSVQRDQQTGAIDLSKVPEGMLGKVWEGMKNNSNLLMGLGAGMMGAPSWATGFSRGLAGAQAGSNVDYRQNTAVSGQNALYQSLVQAGAPKLQAIAATTNPKLAEQLTQEYLVDRKTQLQKITQNGVERTVRFNPFTQEVTELDGSPFGGAGAGATGIDPNLTGEAAEAAAKESMPDIYRRAKAMLAGQSRYPTSPRDKEGMEAARLARQIDPGANEQEILTRNQYMRDVGNTKSGVGFAVRGFDQGAEHLVKIARMIEKYNPSGGLGSEDLANLSNRVSEHGTKQAGILSEIKAEAGPLSGEMHKLYSGSSGGGVSERATTDKRFSTVGSREAAAGNLEGTIEMMEGGIGSLERDRDRKMGPDAENLHPSLKFRTDAATKNIEEVKHIIARLRGQEPALPKQGQAPATAPAGPAKLNWSVIQ